MSKVLTSKLEIVRCVNQIPKADTNYPLEWKINTTDNEYLDPRIFLLLEADIRKLDGTPLIKRVDTVSAATYTIGPLEQVAESDVLFQVDDPASTTTPKAKKEISVQSNVGAVNNILLSQFRDYEFLINGQPFRNQNSCYAHWAFIRTLLTFNEVSKKSVLDTQGWNLDVDDPECTDATSQYNPGYYDRSKRFWLSRKATLFGPLLTDLYDCTQPLYSNSEYTIRLFRQPHSFSLMSHEPDANYVLNIMKAELYITKLTISTTIPRSIKFTQSDVRLVNVPAHVRNVDAEIYQGELPRRVIILQVWSDSFSGSYAKNPFNLQNFKATNINVLINGNAHPVENNMLAMDPRDLRNAYIVAYTQLYGLNFEDAMVGITIENFKGGTFLWPVTLDSTEKNGVMRLQIDYQETLGAPATILVIADFDRKIEMENSGKIVVT